MYFYKGAPSSDSKYSLIIDSGLVPWGNDEKEPVIRIEKALKFST